MVFLVLLILLLVFVVLPRLMKSGPLGDARTRIMTSGLPARGLVLSAAKMGSDTRLNGQRFELRNVLLDVEVQGRAPYELRFDAMFPRLCESFPGTALDLRVDPANPNNVVVVGPAGSSAWIGAAAWLLPQGTSPIAQASASGCGTVVLVMVCLLLAGGAGLSFFGGSLTSSEPEAAEHPKSTPTATHAVVPTVEPPTVTQTHADCEAAARCCKALGRPKCVFSGSEASCKASLDEEKRAAAKVGKACH